MSAAAAPSWVLAATILASGMAFIDASVVNVALPTLQRALGAGGTAMQWVVNAYALMLGALILLGGAAGDRFGRRRVFLAGIALFAAASLACGAAPGVATLIAARLVQGVGGALMVPQSLALIAAAFPGEERARAVGTWAAAAALTTAAGPPLGGWLMQAASWRAVFLVNLPLAAAAAGLALARVPESRDPLAAPLDWPGAALVTSGLGALTWSAIAAAQRGVPALAVAAGATAGLALLAGFVAHEARTAHPMLPLRLFRSADFCGANLATLLLYGGLSGAMFLLPFALIRLRGDSGAEAGASFLPLLLLLGLLSRATGALSRRTGPLLPLVAGPALAAAGFAALGFVAAPAVPYWRGLLPALSVLGLGMAITIPPLTTVALDSVEDRLSGTASGVNNAVARVAGLLAVAVLGAAALLAQSHRLAQGVPDRLRATVAAATASFAAVALPPDVGSADAAAVEAATGRAFLATFQDVGLACAGLALAAALCAFLTIGRRPRYRKQSPATPGAAADL